MVSNPDFEPRLCLIQCVSLWRKSPIFGKNDHRYFYSILAQWVIIITVYLKQKVPIIIYWCQTHIRNSFLIQCVSLWRKSPFFGKNDHHYFYSILAHWVIIITLYLKQKVPFIIYWCQTHIRNSFLIQCVSLWRKSPIFGKMTTITFIQYWLIGSLLLLFTSNKK